jgi:hypothetical protein
VEFVVIVWGWAAIFHGSAHLTNELDICYSRDKEIWRGLPAPWHHTIRARAAFLTSCLSFGTQKHWRTELCSRSPPIWGLSTF